MGCRPQEGFSIVGRVSDEAFREDRRSAQAEVATVIGGTLVYHYFEEVYLRPVSSEGRICSKARCYSRTEIEASIGTDDPHYGDGAYVTCNRGLRSAHREVKLAHGQHVASRRYRVVLKVRQQAAFRKISRTGGVSRTVPEETLLEEGQPIWLGGDERAEYLWIEAYVENEDRWRRWKG